MFLLPIFTCNLFSIPATYMQLTLLRTRDLYATHPIANSRPMQITLLRTRDLCNSPYCELTSYATHPICDICNSPCCELTNYATHPIATYATHNIANSRPMQLTILRTCNLCNSPLRTVLRDRLRKIMFSLTRISYFQV